MYSQLYCTSVMIARCGIQDLDIDKKTIVFVTHSLGMPSECTPIEKCYPFLFKKNMVIYMTLLLFKHDPGRVRFRLNGCLIC